MVRPDLVFFEVDPVLAGFDGVVQKVEMNLILHIRSADADTGQRRHPDGFCRLFPLVARNNDVVGGVDNQGLYHAKPLDAVLQLLQCTLRNNTGVVC